MDWGIMGWIGFAFAGWIFAGISYHYSKGSVLPMWKLLMRGVVTAAALALFFAGAPWVTGSWEITTAYSSGWKAALPTSNPWKALPSGSSEPLPKWRASLLLASCLDVSNEGEAIYIPADQFFFRDEIAA